jgi:hypothetical protein
MGEKVKTVGRRLWHERDKGMGQTGEKTVLMRKRGKEEEVERMAIGMKGDRSRKITK